VAINGFRYERPPTRVVGLARLAHAEFVVTASARPGALAKTSQVKTRGSRLARADSSLVHPIGYTVVRRLTVLVLGHEDDPVGGGEGPDRLIAGRRQLDIRDLNRLRIQIRESADQATGQFLSTRSFGSGSRDDEDPALAFRGERYRVQRRTRIGRPRYNAWLDGRHARPPSIEDDLVSIEPLRC
jgi:hypothetical protein